MVSRDNRAKFSVSNSFQLESSLRKQISSDSFANQHRPQSDRLVVGSPLTGFDADTGDCPIKAAPYVRDCEDTLLDQQRLARDSRDGNELQRRICW